ncbi:MAG: hypothetical protein GY934_14535, partial [Gammaproteobacteria bacterium]|nr:hypothetical protein [Gammaproteobacteria bacterium]
AAYRTHINDVLLTALMLALRDWTGDTRHLIDLESHGRTDLFADIDLSRTVGWFTSLHTIYLALPDTGNLGDSIQAIRKQLRQILHNGVGYGVLRYLKGEVLPQGDIVFNYLGQFDQSVQESLFSFAEESSGQSMSLEGEREHLIEINGQTVKGELSLTFSYSREQYESATIQRLADAYQCHLQQLIEHAQTWYQSQPDLSTLLPLQSGGSSLPLFCLPGLGSIAGYFHQLAMSLGPEQPLYGLQSPGLDGQTDIPATVEALASHNVKVIRQVQSSGPYQLAGHSFGSAVALEMALQLEQQGDSVGLLAIFDQPTPQSSDSEKNQEERAEVDWIWDIVEILKILTGMTPPVSLETLKASNNPWYCYQTVMNWLKSKHVHEMLFTAESKPEELRALVQVYKTNALAFPLYRPAQRRVQCPIDLFYAEESVDDRDLPEYWGWAEHTQTLVRIHQVPGSHITMLSNPFVKTLAAQLHILLSSTQAMGARI